MRKYIEQKNLLGFTLIELVLVIAILGVLAVAALPSLFDVSLSTARTNAMKGTVGAIQAGLGIYAASQISQGLNESYPATLDSATDGAAATSAAPLFVNILQNGVNAQWFRIDADCYAFDTDGDSTLDNGSGDAEFVYSSANGTFLEAAASCG